MEIGCDTVLLNSAIAHANDPVRMARDGGGRPGRSPRLPGRPHASQDGRRCVQPADRADPVMPALKAGPEEGQGEAALDRHFCRQGERGHADAVFGQFVSAPLRLAFKETGVWGL